MGRRTNIGMAGTLPSVEQGLRSDDRDNRGLGTHSYDSSHGPSPGSFITRFGNTLLDLSKYDCIVSMATAIDVEWFRNLGSPGSETEYEEGLDGCARGEIDWRRD